MVADDSLKKEPQRNADLRHLRHFPPEAAHYCPDESYSVASDSRAGAGDGASAGAGAPVVAAVLLLLLNWQFYSIKLLLLLRLLIRFEKVM
jgi:hypothetical protein